MLIEDLPLESKVRGVFEELDASDSQFKSEFLESKYSNSLIGVDSENLTLPDECGLIISDRTKQHCRNKRWLLLKPELLWSYSQCSSIKWIEHSATKYILPRMWVYMDPT